MFSAQPKTPQYSDNFSDYILHGTQIRRIPCKNIVPCDSLIEKPFLPLGVGCVWVCLYHFVNQCVAK